MRMGNRKPRPSAGRRRGVYRPAGEGLESRVVPAAIDLFNIAGNPATTPPGGPPGPFGILEAGATTVGGAGFSVAELGDVNGDGFDDFAAGAPTLSQTGTTLGLGSGVNSTVYLVFGSRDVTVGTFDFRNLTFLQRTGDLGQLGNGNQTNPSVTTPPNPSLNYDGLIFTATSNLNSQLGASVTGLGDINGDGLADFMIGSPGGNDITGTVPGAGRAYLVYGSRTLVRQNKMVNFDDPTGTSLVGLNVLTFVNAVPNARTGASVAGIGDVLTDGVPEIAIGSPGASFNGLAGNGAVYVISGAALQQARTATIRLDQVGQTGGVPGVIFAGARAGEQAGFSVAPAGNVDGDLSASRQPIADFLIGAPASSVGPGSAYLIYGAAGNALPTLALPSPGGGAPINVSLTRISSAAPDVAGAVFTGDAATAGDTVTDLTGLSVAAAGDFNGDALGDFLIGSPGFNLNTTTVLNSGRVSLIYGSTTRTVGSVSLSNLGTVNAVTFQGASANDMAGTSVSGAGRINADTLNEILIGAPGFNNGAGVGFLIPGNPSLLGPQPLDTSLVQATPVQALVITLSQQPLAQGRPNFLGASVSGRIPSTQPTQQGSIDADTLGDVIIGAPAFSLIPTGATSTTRALAGGVYALEGAFLSALLPVPIPGANAIPVQIGVETPAAPFVVNALTPPPLPIFVLSNATVNPPFRPVTDINPATIVVNNIPIPNATITADPVDENFDGITDAIVTIPSRAALNLTTATTTLTITGRTLASSPNANRQFSGTATIRVVGAGGGGGVVPGAGTPLNVNLFFPPPNTAVPRFGERLIPQRQVLSKLRWKPLPVRRAYRQFLPTDGFTRRFVNFFHPVDVDNPGGRDDESASGVTTLGRNVFTRGKFKAGQIRFPRIDHGQPTIPPT
jgi:hypothetical protein